MALSNAVLESLAMSTAISGVKMRAGAGLDPGDTIRARATVDRDQVAAYVASHRRSPTGSA